MIVSSQSAVYVTSPPALFPVSYGRQEDISRLVVVVVSFRLNSENYEKVAFVTVSRRLGNRDWQLSVYIISITDRQTDETRHNAVRWGKGVTIKRAACWGEMCKCEEPEERERAWKKACSPCNLFAIIITHSQIPVNDILPPRIARARLTHGNFWSHPVCLSDGTASASDRQRWLCEGRVERVWRDGRMVGWVSFFLGLMLYSQTMGF